MEFVGGLKSEGDLIIKEMHALVLALEGAVTRAELMDGMSVGEVRGLAEMLAKRNSRIKGASGDRAGDAPPQLVRARRERGVDGDAGAP